MMRSFVALFNTAVLIYTVCYIFIVDRVWFKDYYEGFEQVFSLGAVYFFMVWLVFSTLYKQIQIVGSVRSDLLFMGVFSLLSFRALVMILSTPENSYLLSGFYHKVNIFGFGFSLASIVLIYFISDVLDYIAIQLEIVRNQIGISADNNNKK